jgi:hypothetical protein
MTSTTICVADESFWKQEGKYDNYPKRGLLREKQNKNSDVSSISDTELSKYVGRAQMKENILLQDIKRNVPLIIFFISIYLIIFLMKSFLPESIMSSIKSFLQSPFN